MDLATSSDPSSSTASANQARDGDFAEELFESELQDDELGSPITQEDDDIFDRGTRDKIGLGASDRLRSLLNNGLEHDFSDMAELEDLTAPSGLDSSSRRKVHIKQEPRDPRIIRPPSSTEIIDLCGDEDPPIKKEPEQPFVWTTIPEETIEISDSDDDDGDGVIDLEKDAPEPESEPERSLGRSVPKPQAARPHRSPAAIERLKQAQRRYMESVHGKSTGDNGISPAPKIDQGDEDDSDWMNDTYIPDEAPPDYFAEVKRAYMAKCKGHKNTIIDDINYKKAEKDEQARLKRTECQATESDEELFFPEYDPEASRSNKRSADKDNHGQESSRAKKRKSKDTSKRTRAELNKELEDNMLAGIEGVLGKKKSAITGTGKGSKAPKRQNRKDKQDQPAKVPKGKKKTQKIPKRPKPSQPGYMNDSESLMTSNVYEDANANLGKQGLPAMNDRNKSKALATLIAGIPLDDLQRAKSEKQQILHMTQILGSVKPSHEGPNGEGKGWNMKGMTQVLHHHQVQGAGAMKAREIGVDKPLGGDNELAKHAEKKFLPTVIRHHGSNRISSKGASGRGAVEIMERADIVLTTYSELMKSYPKPDIPEELKDIAEKKAWWQEQWEKRKLLHQAQFFRVILDEAQIIKNYRSRTSIACRAIMAKHRWAISGTPILNEIEELYPYFKLLRMPHTGSYPTFKQNFCVRGSNVCNQRLHSFLDKILIRRTYKSTLFERPIIEMPATHQETIELEFNIVERKIYNIIHARYIRAINKASLEGTLEQRGKLVLTMLLRLRQMTAHIFMLQETMEKIFELEDIEMLWKETSSEVSTEGNSRDMMISMRKMIAAKDDEPIDEDPDENERSDGDSEPGAVLIFKFRKYLRQLKSSSKWAELKERSLCHKCSAPPDEPWLSSCLHLYCHECLLTMAHEAAANNQDSSTCVACNEVFSESHPCTSLSELETEPTTYQDGAPKVRPKRKAKDNMKWVDLDGQILPSTKTAAVQAQIEKWLKEEPQKKIIIFSQFHLVMQVLGKMCERMGLNYCTYHGQMSHSAREDSIESFKNDPEKMVMIASLKCGGIGLNLTMASKVIMVDLWFNSKVEQQAFCRVFRIGQTEETFLTRFVIKDTIDERLLRMQKRKDRIIEAAMDDRTVLSKLTLEDMMQLFGDVAYNDNAKPFIYTDDDPEKETSVWPMHPEEEDDPVAWAG
ncbi:hypothetical protein ACLMJK_003313 [Lecanora helva]